MNYLISANSYHIINDEIKKIVENNNYITFNMNLSSVSDLLEEASYYSLDGMNKIIVASNADFFGSKKINEKEMEKLSNYLSNPVKSTMIIFTTLNGFDLRKKITKEIKNMNGLISYDKLDKRSISNYLNEYLKKNNYSCDYKILNYIIDNSYDNLDIMYNEIDKIMLYYTKPCSFILQDVKKIVGKELDSNNFHFISAVVEKKLSEALRLLKDLKVYKVEILSLIILLAREYRLMYYVKNLYNKMGTSGLMKKYNLFDWQINKLYTNSLKYTNQELLENICDLAKLDINVKKGLWDKEVSLYTFLLKACI